MHVHDKGVLGKPALFAVYKWNAPQLEPERPINVSLTLVKRSCYKSARLELKLLNSE